MTTLFRSMMVLVFGLAGCSSGPKYTVDDKIIASMTVPEKEGILGAESERNQARAEQQKIEADLNSIETDVGIANNEHQGAKLQLDTAKLHQKSANGSGDINRKNAAAREYQIAEYGIKATDAKIEWLAKRRKWLKASLEAAERRITAALTRRELEKAKLAQAKGIRPSESFELRNFEGEDNQKQRNYLDARQRSEKFKSEADNLERAYEAQRQQWEATKNGTPNGAPEAVAH
jgi:chromosome segregation ATPase